MFQKVFIRHHYFALIVLLMMSIPTFPSFSEPIDENDIFIQDVEYYFAIDNVCAWPNLTMLPDGTIAALIYNQPSHGGMEGEIDCYTSKDGGRTWQFTGRPIQHKTETNHFNHAAGLANDGSFVVVTSGREGKNLRKGFLPNAVCRSKDGGKTWTHEGHMDDIENADYVIPFGDIVKLNDKVLGCPVYTTEVHGGKNQMRSYLFQSYDDGITWKDPLLIGERGHKSDDYILYMTGGEPFVLTVKPDRLLAAIRRSHGGNTSDLELLVSEDQGKTWNVPDNMLGWGITGYLEHPAHLLKLRDGRILLTYGIRWSERGIGARISNDEGRTWSPPMVIFQYGYEWFDWGGYPACVELEDGTIVTVYYDGPNDLHPRYHMSALRWKIPESLKTK